MQVVPIVICPMIFGVRSMNIIFGSVPLHYIELVFLHHLHLLNWLVCQ